MAPEWEFLEWYVTELAASSTVRRLQNNNPNVVHFFLFFPPQATVVCDLVLLYLLPKREFYKNMKFKYTDTHAQVRDPAVGLLQYHREHRGAAESVRSESQGRDRSAIGSVDCLQSITGRWEAVWV